MTLKFLALHGTPYIYDISRLRVNISRACEFCPVWLNDFFDTESMCQLNDSHDVHRVSVKAMLCKNQVPFV
jgi:hypothetical protein